jgi:hypothetical protein
LIESQQATSPDFNIYIHTPKYLHGRQQRSFQGRDRQSLRRKQWSRDSSPHKN